MATKTLAPKRKPAAASAPRVTIVELDAKTITEFMGKMTAVIERNSQLLGRFPSPSDTVSESVGEGMSPGAAKPPSLPPLESIAHELADKVRTVYGFSCHLREQVENVPPLEKEFMQPGPGLKGVLDTALHMLDAAHENFVLARNVIS